jgi:hypothetical protein
MLRSEEQILCDVLVLKTSIYLVNSRLAYNQTFDHHNSSSFHHSSEFFITFSHSSIIVYSILHSWKAIVFDEFQKESHKEFDFDSESIEMIDFTINNAKKNMSRMKNVRFLAWRKTFTIMNDNRHLHDVFSSRMRSCKNRFIANDWINWHKNQKMKRKNSFERKIQ